MISSSERYLDMKSLLIALVLLAGMNLTGNMTGNITHNMTHNMTWSAELQPSYFSASNFDFPEFDFNISRDLGFELTPLPGPNIPAGCGCHQVGPNMMECTSCFSPG